MALSRRAFVSTFSIGALAAIFPQRAGAYTTCRRISGAGAYTIGPFEPAEADADPVYLVADLGFDETMVFCKVTTNFSAFHFPTATMGIVTLDPHEFFMDMRSTRIDSLEIEESDTGPVAVYGGIMRSETRLFSGERMRTLEEGDITFGCRATQFRHEATVAVSGVNFSMTAHFQPGLGHAAVFGPEATFAGRVEQGNIIVIA